LRQEYCCSFEALQGLVFPNFARCLTHSPLPGSDTYVGGIDFGFRNPFAAVWGILDSGRNLWLTGEHYARQQPLSYHAARLPRHVTWYADPSGASERSELRRAGFTVHKGLNALRPRLAAVTARIQSHRLFIREGACPNLMSEAGLYRYPEARNNLDAEDPVDDHNHALSALRYLIASIDQGRQIASPPRPPSPPPPARRRWLHWTNSALYRRIF
jgi:hypothetical protein